MSARHTHLITSDNFFNDFSTLKKQLIIVAEGTVFRQVGEAQWNRSFPRRECASLPESPRIWSLVVSSVDSTDKYSSIQKILGNHVVPGLYRQSTAYPWLTRL